MKDNMVVSGTPEIEVGSLGRYVKRVRHERVLFVSSSRLKTGVIHHAAMLQNGWKNVVVDEEPSLELVTDLVGEIKDEYDLILAIGGGSVVDAAKLLGASRLNPAVIQVASKSPSDVVLLPSPPDPIPVVAFPTTIGSGSNASSSSVVTFGGRKIALVSPSIRPQLSVLDIALLDAPAAVKAASMLDAFTHALESLGSRLPDMTARLLASMSLGALTRHATEALGGSEAAVVRCAVAGTWAGYAQDQLLVGPAHALAHACPEGPHGVLVGTINFHLLEAYQQHEPEYISRIQNAMLDEGSSLAALMDTLEELVAAAGSVDWSAMALVLRDPRTRELASTSGVMKASSIRLTGELLDDLCTRLAERSTP